MKCGLLGEKLSHSYSPQIHGSLASYSYALFEKKPEELPFFLNNGDFSGINVTIPYKKAVIPFCQELSETAKKLGAVNTIVRKPDGTLIGHNSDYFGFQSMLNRSGINVAGKKVLVLGSGGASATAVCVLKETGANVVVISRSGENNYQNLSMHADAAVIVNTTPVGMYPKVGISPVDLALFPNLEGVLDVIYNPARTKLIMDAEERGIISMNGLWMLVAQAKESAEWFTGKSIPDDKIGSIHAKLKKQMQNIILIGMPGCGKSTVGFELSNTLRRPYIDADAAIEEKTGMCIPEIFSRYGESGFRKIETNVLEELGRQSGLIIATGGGCVTQPTNYPLLHQNGTILWLKRNIHALPTDGRPLSQAGKMESMYAVRRPMYEKYCDYIIDNNSSIEQTIQAIVELGVF